MDSTNSTETNNKKTEDAIIYEMNTNTDCNKKHKSDNNSGKKVKKSDNATTTPAKIRKSKSSKLFSLNCNKCLISIGSIWYCLIILALHSYLIRNQILKLINLTQTYLSILRKLKLSNSIIQNNNYDYVISLFENFDYSTASSDLSNNNSTYLMLESNEINSITLLKNEIFFELSSRLSMLVISIIFLLIFVVTTLRKCDNYSNDGFKFGRDFFNDKSGPHLNKLNLKDLDSSLNEKKINEETVESSNSNSSSISSLTSYSNASTTSCCCKEKILKPLRNLSHTIWSHFMPISSFCHLISILSLFITDLIFQNNLKKLLDYKTCLNTQDDIFSNQELNFILLNMNITKTFYYEYKNENLSQCLLANFFKNTFKSINSTTSNSMIIYDMSFLIEQFDLYKFELLSILIAQVAMFTRYGSVFWYTNKTLSFIITLIGIIASLQQLSQLYSFIYITNQIEFNYLYKEIKRALFHINSNSNHMNNNNALDTIINQSVLMDSIDKILSSIGTTFSELTSSPEPKKLLYLIDTKFHDSQNDLSLLIRNRFTLLFLYVILSVFVYLSATPAYVFTYLKYKERFSIEESLFVRSIQKTCKSNIENVNDENEEDENLNLVNYNNSICCFNYCPHLIATIQLIIICACKIPFCYDYIIYFNNLKDFGIMINIIVEIMHTIILLFIWLTLTLRTEWNMHLKTEYSICHWTYHVKKNELRIKKLMKKHKEKMSFEINNIAIKSLATNQNNTFENFDNSVAIRMHNRQICNYNNSNNNQYKHKSMFVDDKYFNQSQNNNNLELIDSNSDCMLNSETMYRNEIRKSIRNVMQQKTASNANNYSNNNSSNNYQGALSYRLKSYITSNSNTGLNNSTKKLCTSGVYLTSTSILGNNNSSSIKIPIILSNDEITSNNENHNQTSRPILYLDNKNSSSSEYESRV